MFVVKKPAASNKTIRLPDELIGKLNRIAADKGGSFNNLVHQCIEYALDDLADDTEEPKQNRRQKPKK